jgi:two-component system nitrogen regulation sensor histidine kinase NtrY
MRLRFAVSGQPAKAGAKEQGADKAESTRAKSTQTNTPAGETIGPAGATNSEAKIQAATGS